jgi:hypothetical protein
MAEEKELTIVLKAKNLTHAEFESARKELSGLGDASKDTEKKGEGLGPSFKTSFSAIAVAGTAVVAGIGAITAGVIALGQRGAEVSDIKGHFNDLNTAIGNNADTMISKLRSATLGTITDFELMKATNIGLSQGLKLNEDQFGLTGKAAQILADRVGGDTKDAYEKLVMAMTTGQDKTLKGIGLNIDAAAAADAHAKALGKTTGELTEAEKITASRNAILAEMQRVLEQSGEAEADFADRINQGRVALENWRDELGLGIADSPIFSAGMEGMGNALTKAFGGEHSRLIADIVGLIEDAAMMAIDLGQAGLSAADVLVKGFYGIRAMFFDTLGGVVALETGMADLAASVYEWRAGMPFATDEVKKQAREMREHATVSGGMRDSIKATADEARAAATGNNALSRTIDGLKTGLGGAKSAMEAARREQLLGTKATDDATTGLGTHAVAQRAHATLTKAQADEIEKLAKAQSELFGSAMIARADLMARALGDVGNITKLTTEKKEELRKAVDAALEVYRLLGRDAPKALHDIHAATLPLLVSTRQWATVELKAAVDNLTPFEASVRSLGVESVPQLSTSIDKSRLGFVGLKDAVVASGTSLDAAKEKTHSFNDSLESLAGTLAQLAQVSGGTFGGIVQQIATVVVAAQAGAKAGEAFRNGWNQGGSQGFASMATGILGAASAMGQATSQGNTLQRTLGGISTGAAIGTAIFPGLGTAIGLGAGAIIGFIRGITQISPAIKDARKDVEAFQQTLAATLTATQLQEAGGERWKMTIIAVRDALISIGRAGDEAMPLVAQLWDTDHPERARAAMEQIAKLIGDQQTEQQILNDAVREYGFTIEELGPKFRAQELSAQAQKLVEQYAVLTDSEIDVALVATKMADNTNEYLRVALRTNAEVPRSMEPMLKKMAEMGLLTDENGDKLTDLERIPWAQTMTQGFDRVVGAVERLIATIGGGLGGAVNRAGDAVEREFYDRIIPAIEEGGRALDEFNFGKSPGGLKEIPILLKKAAAEINPFRDFFRDAMKAAEHSLDAVLKKMGDFKEGMSFGRISGPPAEALAQIERLESQIAQLETLQKTSPESKDAATAGIELLKKQIDDLRKLIDPFEGFAKLPELLSETSALARINEVFQQYMGHSASAGELTSLAAKYGYGGKGQISKDRLDDFLKEVVDAYLENKYAGFAEGTKTGSDKWFMDFGRGRTVRVHDEEAIVPKSRVREFVNDVGGGGGATSVTVGETVVHVHVSLDPVTGRISRIGPAEIRDIQKALDTGQCRVPSRVVTQRSR